MSVLIDPNEDVSLTWSEGKVDYESHIGLDPSVLIDRDEHFILEWKGGWFGDLT